MQCLLSVLLPVRDAQSTLNDTVADILEEASDFGGRFELLIIDDGSSDATNEVAHEITLHYPQVRLVRHELPLGREASIRTGLRDGRGEVVVLRDDCPGGFRLIERRRRPTPHAPSRPARPNFLDRLKSFALGE